MHIILPVLIFILPSFMVRWLLRLLGYKIGRRCRIGFSWVDVSDLEMDDGAWIGNANFIKVPLLSMGIDSYIRDVNVLKGNFDVIMRDSTVINKFNKVTNAFIEDRSLFLLKMQAIVGVWHIIDVTTKVIIGENSIIAGCGSQLWTHGFYHSKKTGEHMRVQSEIEVGDNVYVGSRVIICAGVKICDNCTIGAGATVAKNITKPGMYVNQPLRFIEFDPDEAASKLKKIRDGYYEK